MVTKSVDEVKSYVVRLLSSKGVHHDKYKAISKWLDKVREDNFLDIVAFQIWTRFNIARYLEARLLAAGKKRRRAIREEESVEAVRQLADLMSQKIALQDLREALKGLDVSPIVVYYPTILDLEVRPMNGQPVELGEPLKFDVQIRNSSDIPFERSALVISADSEYYSVESVDSWSKGQGREPDKLSRDETMNTTMTLKPMVEKLTNYKLDHTLTFSLRTVEALFCLVS